jgi:hypothetical protein
MESPRRNGRLQIAVLACWRVGHAARCNNSVLRVAIVKARSGSAWSGSVSWNSWSSAGQRHLQRVDRQLVPQVIGERSANDGLLHGSRMIARYSQPSHRADVGDVRDPYSIESSRAEVAPHQVR